MQRKFRAHIGPLFKEQKILLIDKIIEHSRIKFMHSFCSNNFLYHLLKLGYQRSEKSPSYIRNVDDLHIPAHRVEFVKRLPLFSFPSGMEYYPRRKIKPTSTFVL
jgi:hypothetical protein